MAGEGASELRGASASAIFEAFGWKDVARHRFSGSNLLILAIGAMVLEERGVSYGVHDLRQRSRQDYHVLQSLGGRN